GVWAFAHLRSKQRLRSDTVGTRAKRGFFDGLKKTAFTFLGGGLAVGLGLVTLPAAPALAAVLTIGGAVAVEASPVVGLISGAVTALRD
ncbi:MAG: hypothetical protein AAF658_08095, partial [Myxococcota bacterium]